MRNQSAIIWFCSSTTELFYLGLCLDAIASGGNPQDRNGAFSVGELNSPRVAPLHRFFTFMPTHP
ncbi:hypothetical protein, partial [Moorena sp. SIO2C4]|uniref:hypothetical protein n=1 Tax=Moorena sp. SIO2C4 TaxID=2607824 RepID=UPI00257C0698